MRGEFWLAGAPEKRLTGRLDVYRGLLTIEGGHLVDCISDANETYSILGIVETGTEITIPQITSSGCKHTARSTEQNFLLLYLLEGAHGTTSERYTEAKVSFAERWRPWLLSASSCLVLDLPQQGQVKLLMDDGLRFSVLRPLTHDEFQRYLIGPLQTLLMLLSGQNADPEALVLHNASGHSVTVKRPARPTDDSAARHFRPILGLAAVGLRGLSAWYALTEKIVPVTSVIAKTVAATGYDVELRVLILAASAEAVHRELYDEETMSKQAARKIRKAALAAVPDDARPRVNQLLQRLRDLNYSERLYLLVARLESLATDIAGKVPATDGDAVEGEGVKKGRALWVEAVKNARNGFAHVKRNSPEDLRRYAREMHVLYESLRWTLTAVLLLHIGVSLQKIRDGFQQSSPYMLFRQRAVYEWPDIYAFHDVDRA